uniref:FH2 domain-containing protein n=1 Tax=Mesocestoides corti TaxID=53468 RepID=A0A5K3EWD9_MESCO
MAQRISETLNRSKISIQKLRAYLGGDRETTAFLNTITKPRWIMTLLQGSLESTSSVMRCLEAYQNSEPGSEEHTSAVALISEVVGNENFLKIFLQRFSQLRKEVTEGLAMLTGVTLEEMGPIVQGCLEDSQAPLKKLEFLTSAPADTIRNLFEAIKKCDEAEVESNAEVIREFYSKKVEADEEQAARLARVNDKLTFHKAKSEEEQMETPKKTPFTIALPVEETKVKVEETKAVQAPPTPTLPPPPQPQPPSLPSPEEVEQGKAIQKKSKKRGKKEVKKEEVKVEKKPIEEEDKKDDGGDGDMDDILPILGDLYTMTEEALSQQLLLDEVLVDSEDEMIADSSRTGMDTMDATFASMEGLEIMEDVVVLHSTTSTVSGPDKMELQRAVSTGEIDISKKDPLNVALKMAGEVHLPNEAYIVEKNWTSISAVLHREDIKLLLTRLEE